MFDLLTPGKKISLFASLAIAFMLLTAFVVCIAEADFRSSPNPDWLCYYSVMCWGVILFFSELDFHKISDIVRVATCALVLVGVIGLIGGKQWLPLVMWILALGGAVTVVIMDLVTEQKFNIVYTAIAFAFFLLMVFWIILIAGVGTKTLALMAYDIPLFVLFGAAGFNSYLIIKEAY